MQQSRPIGFVGGRAGNRRPRCELGDGGARSLVEAGRNALTDDAVEKEPIVDRGVSAGERERGAEQQLA